MIFANQPFFNQDQADPLAFAGGLILQSFFNLLICYQSGFYKDVPDPDLQLLAILEGIVDGLLDDDLWDLCPFSNDLTDPTISLLFLLR